MAKLELTGLKEAQAQLRRLAQRAPADVLAPAVKAGLDVLAAGVKANVPVRTGKLRNSTATKVGQPNGTRVVGAVSLGAKNKQYDYGVADEFGTSRMPGQHFLRGALDAKGAQAQAAAATEARRRIERLAGT